MKFITLYTFLIALACANEKEFTRSYYLGYQSPHFWHNKDPKFEAHPFAPDDNDPDRYRPSTLNPPFQSPHFREGDQLWDFKKHPDFHLKIPSQASHLIYNQSSNRIILRGDHEAHAILTSYADANLAREDKSIDLSLTIHTLKLPTSKPISAQTIADQPAAFSARFLNTPGQPLDLHFGPNDINIQWEAQTDTQCTLVECRLMLFGELGGNSLSYKGGFTAAANTPFIFHIGREEGSEFTHIITLHPRITLANGLRFEEMILGENGKPLAKLPRPIIDESFFLKGKLDSKTNKYFKAFNVPPDFLSFISTSYSGDTDGDPFAVDPAKNKKPTAKEYLLKWDPRIAAIPTDRVIDLQKPLTENGLSFEKGDWAALNQTTNTLFIYSSETNLELVEGIGCFGHFSPPRNVHTQLLLVESENALTRDDLSRHDLKVIARAHGTTLPGQDSVTNIGNQILQIQSQIEADQKITSNIDFKTSEDQTLSTTVSGSFTLPDDVPRLLQAYQSNGKWRSLIIITSALSIFESSDP